MEKYANMVAHKKGKSKEKTELALSEIKNMFRNQQEISVAELVKRTGLSRGFFYKNETVRNAFEKTRKQQIGIDFHSSKKKIFDTAMEKEILLLKAENIKREEEIRRLKSELEKYKKAVERLQISSFKSL